MSILLRRAHLRVQGSGAASAPSPSPLCGGGRAGREAGSGEGSAGSGGVAAASEPAVVALPLSFPAARGPLPRRGGRESVALAALAAALLAAAAAQAQTFSGLGPAPLLVLPRPGAPIPAPAVADPVPAAPREADPALRRLPAVAAPLRIWGENGARAFAVYATEAEARAGGRFQVGYLAAVSVLPETARLSLRLNGTEIGGTPIDGARGARVAAFDLPPGALVRGFNRVEIAVEQHHRVDCSVPATYELWTQIDPETTGLLSAAPGPADPADLAAIRPGPDGAVPLRVIQTGARLTERGVERALSALQTTALAGRFGQPAADFGPAAEAGDGLALAVGTAAELAGAADLAALGPVAGPRLALLPATGARRAVLVATGADEAEVAAALADLGRLAAAPPPGSPAGLRALADADGRRVEGGETLTLADLGFADAHVAARSHRIVFDLALPPDLLAADYDRLALDLDLAYPAGLAAGAQIRVEIDGADAGSAPLGRPRGEAMQRRTVFLPLHLLHPGRNRVAITAELPRAEDAACLAAPGERLHLAATSRLRIPPLARVGRQPELAATAAAGFPYAAARRPTLLVPAPDRDTMAAAATLAARLGLAAGRPIAFGFSAGRTAIATPGPTVVVSAARTLDGSLLAAAGIDPRAAGDALGEADPSAPREPDPVRRRRLLRTDGIAACRTLAPAPANESVSDGARKPTALLAQGVTGPAADDVTTLVSAASPAALREAVDCLVHPRVWARIAGRRSGLSGSDGAVSAEADPAPRYVLTAPPDPANLRRIAAGWLSLHAGLYGLFGLLLAGGLAGTTQVLVRNLGRRS